MSALTPYIELKFWNYTDLFGSPTYTGESVVWNNLNSQIDGSRPDYVLDGFELSPDNNYILQKSVLIPQSITQTNWTPQAGDTSTYSHGTYPSGINYLWQTNAGNVTSNTLANFSHNQDVFGGFAVDLWLGVPPGTTLTSSNCYFDFYLTDNLRLHIAATESISLQYFNNNAWTIVDQMTGSSDSETYLNKCNRRLHIDVIPLFDISFWNGFPNFREFSNPPPDCLQVSINNGDAVLIWKQYQGTFNAGAIGVNAQHGQWGLGYSLRQYQQNCIIQEPTQVYQVNFVGDPQAYIFGYLPYGSSFEIAPIFPNDYYNQIAATVFYVGANLDGSTGYCTSTCAINQCSLSFPPIFNQTYNAALFSIGTDRIVDLHESMYFDQVNMCRRAQVEVILRNDDGAFSPGQTLNLGNYGVQLFWGWIDNSTGYNDVIQRFTGMLNVSNTSTPTFSNYWENGINYCKIVLQERIVDDQPCGFVVPFDGKSIFTALRELAYKMGFQDSQLGFPFVPRGSVSDSSYHLNYGTSFAPNWQPQPNQTIWEYMLTLISNAAAPNASTGIPEPMVLYVDSLGVLQCYGYDIGIFNSPPPYPGKIYQAAEQFEDGVSTLVQFTNNMSTSTNLANIRTAIILEGINPVDGSPVVAYSNNNTIDGSIFSNPRTPGYIGFPRPYININKYFSSQDSANLVLYTAVTQLSMPVIEAQFGVLAQSGIFPITGYLGNQEIAVYEPFSTGTDAAVGFYVTKIDTHYNNHFDVSFVSEINCRLYGQYGTD